MPEAFPSHAYKEKALTDLHLESGLNCDYILRKSMYFQSKIELLVPGQYSTSGFWPLVPYLNRGIDGMRLVSD